ncbi:MAG: putative ABC transporter permease, partial [Oscillospiraceae bacterium]
SFGAGYFINRGFLNGPFCPIYGFGAILTLWGLQSVNGSVASVFIGGMIITSSLEYITSFAMEKLFHSKWWDYSDKKYNINGRVCLLNSTLFGLLCLFLQFDIHPFIYQLVNFHSYDFKMGFTCALMIYFSVDCTITVRSILGLNKRASVIGKIKNELMDAYELFNEKLELEQFFKLMQDKEIQDERIKDLKQKLSEGNIFEKRLLKAFPQISSKRHNDSLSEIKNFLKNKKN